MTRNIPQSYRYGIYLVAVIAGSRLVIEARIAAFPHVSVRLQECFVQVSPCCPGGEMRGDSGCSSAIQSFEPSSGSEHIRTFQSVANRRGLALDPAKIVAGSSIRHSRHGRGASRSIFRSAGGTGGNDSPCIAPCMAQGPKRSIV
jgi:hypothetical protein